MSSGALRHRGCRRLPRRSVLTPAARRSTSSLKTSRRRRVRHGDARIVGDDAGHMKRAGRCGGAGMDAGDGRGRRRRGRRRRSRRASAAASHRRQQGRLRHRRHTLVVGATLPRRRRVQHERLAGGRIRKHFERRSPFGYHLNRRGIPQDGISSTGRAHGFNSEEGAPHLRAETASSVTRIACCHHAHASAHKPGPSPEVSERY